MEINKDILNRFKVYESDQLFDIEKDDLFRALKERRCIKCGNRLRYIEKSEIFMCLSKKHKKPFFIKKSRLEKINGE